MLEVEFFGVGDAIRMREALAIRRRVFVDEQGVPPEEEVDEYDRSDASAVHALLLCDGPRYIGAARFYACNATTVRIGRMAIDARARGTGAGRHLLAALGDEARRLGFERAHLHAQAHARGFYARAGYVDDGESLWDAGILHQPMTKRL